MRIDLSIDTEKKEDLENAFEILYSLNRNWSPKKEYGEMIPDRRFICETPFGTANIIEEDEDFYRILAGSVVAAVTRSGCPAKAARVRESAVKDGRIEIVGDYGIVRKDIGDLMGKNLAASIVKGTRADGEKCLVPAEPEGKAVYANRRNIDYRNFLVTEEHYKDFLYLYNGIEYYSYLSLRKDLPDEMRSMLYSVDNDGVIVYAFHVCFFNIFNMPLPDTEKVHIRRRNADISLYESVIAAYTWYRDFMIYLESNDIPPSVKSIFLSAEPMQLHRDRLEVLRKCVMMAERDNENVL